MIELEEALRGGTLGESQWTDFKRELSGGRQANRNLATDMASFAVDGGVIYVGVDEDETPPSVKPVDLIGLPERVQQIASTGAIDPPLSVTTRSLESEQGRGVLLLIIPPSADAPHQVDGRYRGRAGVITSFCPMQRCGASSSRGPSTVAAPTRVSRRSSRSGRLSNCPAYS